MSDAHELLAEGLGWAEGPAVLPDGRICFVETYRSQVSVWERGRYIEYLLAFAFYKPVQDYFTKPLIASGCFSIYRTEVLLAHGGWQTRTMAEDMDLTWSMYQAGRTVKFVPEAVCYPIEPHNYHFMHKQLKPKVFSSFLSMPRTLTRRLLLAGM